MEKQERNNGIRKDQLKIRKLWKTSRIQITRDLRDMIHGYIMSDGYVLKRVLTVEQGEKQELFIQWLYEKFDSIRTSSPIKNVSRVHPVTKVKTRSLRFQTRAVLGGFHSMWYKSTTSKAGNIVYQKKLPKTIHCFFNETFISVWYAGDGTKTSGSLGAKFEVTAFTVEERLKLKNLFLTKFDIKAVIISSGTSKKGNPQWALKIPAAEYPKFRALITKLDLIPSIFPYKLHKKK